MALATRSLAMHVHEYTQEQQAPKWSDNSKYGYRTPQTGIIAVFATALHYHFIPVSN